MPAIRAKNNAITMDRKKLSMTKSLTIRLILQGIVSVVHQTATPRQGIACVKCITRPSDSPCKHDHCCESAM
jgi:hypothetical protein